MVSVYYFLQHMRHNGARESIYRHDSVMDTNHFIGFFLRILGILLHLKFPSNSPQVSSIGRLLFNRPVDQSRSISTVDKDSPT